MGNEALPKIVRDSSYRRRGGSAAWLLLKCGECKTPFALYQKDGPGKLLRLYLDRIASSDGERPLAGLNKDSIKRLSCVVCEATIGSPMEYEKDDRPRTALRLVESGAEKTVVRRPDQIPPLNVTQTMVSILPTES